VIRLAIHDLFGDLFGDSFGDSFGDLFRDSLFVKDDVARGGLVRVALSPSRPRVSPSYPLAFYRRWIGQAHALEVILLQT
jgi:hypothetical protein